MISGIPGQYQSKLMDLFRSLPKGTAVILFGSRAKGNFREGSDIDIALRGKDVTLADRDGILSGYEALYLPWKLDLVVYDLINEPALRAHIDRAGKLLLKVPEHI